MRYVFDLDGTLCTLTDGNYFDACPIQSRVNKVNSLYDEGHHITIHTARGMSRSNNDHAKAKELFEDLTRNQLIMWGVKFHELFLGKPAGDVYIDDKAMRDDEYFKID